MSKPETITDDMIQSLRTMGAVCDKQADGLYPMEAVPCYCGASSPQVITTVDRYGMPCQTNLCSRCGLVYMSPRMTAAAYQSFYETEYRTIYRTEDDDDPSFAYRHGKSILDLCEFYDLHHRTVLDIGCGDGRMLVPFIEQGLSCRGIDQDTTAVQRGQALGRAITTESTKDLIAQGVTADLVVLNHVLEHCLNLSEILADVRQLLSPDGMLFVAVPGIHATPINGMFQMAHVYHFTAETLEYVMQCEGWQAFMLSEHIHSFWKPVPFVRDKADIAPQTVRNVADVLGNDPTRVQELRTYNKFSVKQQRKNIHAVLQAGIPDISGLRGFERGREAVIIGGGPSVDEQIETIKNLVDDGACVVAIERMASWCRSHGIIPDYISVLDASEDVPSSLRHIHPETVCITASQCGQSVLDALKGHAQIYSYNCPSGVMDLQTMFKDAFSDRQTVLNSGGSVTLSCMTIAMALGMSSLHIFGFDCHVTKSAYAQGITGVGVDGAKYIDVEVDGKVFTTTGAYLSFAQQFFPLMDTGRQLGFLKSVQLYGDSLALAMGEAWIKAIGLKEQHGK